MINMEKYTCCLCYEDFVGYGNNPSPLKKTGRCCDSCNEKVIQERMKRFLNSSNTLDLPVVPSIGGQD